MIQEIFVTAALVFGGIMYLYFEWQEYRGKCMDTTDGTKIVTYEEKLGDSD